MDSRQEEDQKDLQKYENKTHGSKWVVEEEKKLVTKFGKILIVSKLFYPERGQKKTKRIISLWKNGRSLGFDIEMAPAVAAAIRMLATEDSN